MRGVSVYTGNNKTKLFNKSDVLQEKSRTNVEHNKEEKHRIVRSEEREVRKIESYPKNLETSPGALRRVECDMQTDDPNRTSGHRKRDGRYL